MFAVWNILKSLEKFIISSSQQDFQRPHKHSSHAGSCLETLVWMTLNWWYDKLKSGKVLNVKTPIPERFPHTTSQSFTWLRTFTSKPWHFQSSYCVASSMKSSIKVDIASLLIHYVLWRETIKGHVVWVQANHNYNHIHTAGCTALCELSFNHCSPLMIQHKSVYTFTSNHKAK